MHYLKTLSGWIRRQYRRAIVASLLVVSAATASAAGESNIDTSAAKTAVEDIVDNIKTFFTTDLVKAATTIIGVAVVIWLIFLGWKLIKRAGNKAG